MLEPVQGGDAVIIEHFEGRLKNLVQSRSVRTRLNRQRFHRGVTIFDLPHDFTSILIHNDVEFVRQHVCCGGAGDVGLTAFGGTEVFDPSGPHVARCQFKGIGVKYDGGAVDLVERKLVFRKSAFLANTERRCGCVHTQEPA